MQHDFLSVKLQELDSRIDMIYNRIHMSETASHEQIRAAADSLRKECEGNRQALLNKIRCSKAQIVKRLLEPYTDFEKIVENTKRDIENSFKNNTDIETIVEERILIAEYSLDMAILATNYSLFLAMEALDTEMAKEENEEVNL